MNNQVKYISICADDYGITNKVNKAIIELIDKKRITATSCIVLTKDFLINISELISRRDKIDVGLHITLTNFKPLTNCKNLTTNNKLPSLVKLLFLIIFKKKVLNEIREEIYFQFNKFESILGFKPQFIDGHHHVHQFSFINDIIISLIKDKYKKDNYPWIRVCNDTFTNIIIRKTSIFKSILINLFSISFKKKIIKNSIEYNKGFSGFYNFSNSTNFEYKFLNFLKKIKSEHLIMVHPGISDNKLHKLDSAVLSRDKEYNFLKSISYLKILKSKNIILERSSNIFKKN